MNYFILSVAVLQFGSVVFDAINGNKLRAILMLLYALTNICLAFMEV